MLRPRFRFFTAVILLFLASGSLNAQIAAFKEPARDPGPAGQWRGDSVCTIKNSPCNDEIVVYEIAAVNGQAATFTLKASKIVRGQREFMGLLDCTYEPSTHALNCKAHEKPNGIWSFQM